MDINILLDEIVLSQDDIQAIVLSWDLWCDLVIDRLGEIPEDEEILAELKRGRFHHRKTIVLLDERMRLGKAEVISWPGGLASC